MPLQELSSISYSDSQESNRGLVAEGSGRHELKTLTHFPFLAKTGSEIVDISLVFIDRIES